MMGKLPGKIVYAMILFGAGFITAIYLMVPSPANAAGQTQVSDSSQTSQAAQPVATDSGVIPQDWMIQVRTGIDTCINFAEEYALRAADMIRSHTGQGNPRSG
jgi:hypothetical protein